MYSSAKIVLPPGNARAACVVVFIGVFLLASVVVPSVGAEQTLEYSLAPHAAISITSDAQFLPENGIRGGTGTEQDSYVIEGWDIDASTSWVPIVFRTTTFLRAAIMIVNTTSHVVVRNVQVHDGDRVLNLGIVVRNASNVVIEHSRVWNGNTGVSLVATRNVKVVSNEFHNLITGVSVGVVPEHGGVSSRNMIADNSIYDIQAVGITLLNSTANVISGNSVSWTMWGAEARRNSSENVFVGNHISDSHVGITLWADSHNNTVRDNLVERIELSGIAIALRAHGNLVESNTIRNVGRGVSMREVHGTVVISNMIAANETGVRVLSETDGSVVAGNTIAAPVGIYLCSKGVNHLAPPPNDLRQTDRPIKHCPKMQEQ